MGLEAYSSWKEESEGSLHNIPRYCCFQAIQREQCCWWWDVVACWNCFGGIDKVKLDWENMESEIIKQNQNHKVLKNQKVNFFQNVKQNRHSLSTSCLEIASCVSTTWIIYPLRNVFSLDLTFVASKPLFAEILKYCSLINSEIYVLPKGIKTQKNVPYFPCSILTWGNVGNEAEKVESFEIKKFLFGRIIKFLLWLRTMTAVMAEWEWKLENGERRNHGVAKS